MEKVYFIFDDRIYCGAVMDKKSDGWIVAAGNEVMWLPITEPRFTSLNEALTYKCGGFLTPQ